MTRSTFAFLAVTAIAFGQNQPTPGGWRRVTDPPPTPAPAADQPSDAYGQPLSQSSASQSSGIPPAEAEAAPPPEQNQGPAGALPPQLVLKAGTYVTVRINQTLSTDRNQPGDTFSASLVQPVVVDGVIVAGAGQILYGRVAESQKARTNQPSRLGLELTGLTLVDGTQASVRSQLVGRRGGTTPTGQQVGTVATTTAVGAAIGAVADWGRGAAIGAGVGAAGGIIGVLLTRNQPTVVYPETVLTFATSSAVNINTTRAPLAFRYVDPSDYDRPTPALERRPLPPRPVQTLGWYGPGYSPYYWGPGISFVFGGGYYRPRYFRGGYFYGRPVYRRWR